MWAPEGDNPAPPVIEKITDPQKLLAEIIECLHQEDTRGLKTYILEHKLKDESIFWELILKIGNCITAETQEKNPGFFDVCNRCLLYLIKVGNPKETLLALLEQVDTFIDDVKYKCFLPFVQTALEKIPSKLFHSLDITLEALSSHLRSIPPPENVQLEGEEIKVFHMDKTVMRLTDILEAYLSFLEPFINTVDLQSEKLTEAAKQEALVLKKHVVRVFDHPLCHLILTHDPKGDRAESNSRLCALFAMKLLSKLETDFHRLIRNAKGQNLEGVDIKEANQKASKEEDADLGQEDDDNYENERKLAGSGASSDDVTDFVESWDFKMEITPLAQACLSYLIHVEHLGIEKFPFIYRHDYMLDFHLDTVSLLLQNTKYPINYKGLLFCRSLCDLVARHSIPGEQLDNPGYLKILNDLIHIMIKCPVRDHRILATQVFPAVISRFDDGGRYQIYQSILSSCENSGLKGYLITLLKNDISDNLRKLKSATASGSKKSAEDSPQETGEAINSGGSEYFMGKKLQKVLKLALSLPEGETSDMLENSDQIISSLNLLRFLVLADSPDTNITGFWDFMPSIEKDFTSPLRTGLDLSKAHYNLELDNVKQGRDMLPASGKGPEVSVNVGGMNLPAMEKKEKIELIERAVNTHHVMHSLLCRVSELVDQQRNVQKSK